jgi:hypothetical protein
MLLVRKTLSRRHNTCENSNTKSFFTVRPILDSQLLLKILSQSMEINSPLIILFSVHRKELMFHIMQIVHHKI